MPAVPRVPLRAIPATADDARVCHTGLFSIAGHLIRKCSKWNHASRCRIFVERGLIQAGFL
ncbi:protein of unknown function [Methylocaldum szegediense]|uniref:Transposase n=1 Tax=Methylocaldum szegediense TaxID=73780 RepID=A0ABN8WZE2_9GAMM|nr:protein of unknown function [Methylocaldum szegediense]